MNLLRAFALAMCLVPLCLSGGTAVAAQPAAQPAAAKAKPVQKAAQKKPQPVRKQATKPAATKRKAAAKPISKAVAKPLPKPKLDLSLPVEMVNDLEPNVSGKVVRRKPLLPAMFPNKPVVDDSPFQLNGRLISNEMQLQLRNDSRRDVEGAAIEFEYRQ